MFVPGGDGGERESKEWGCLPFGEQKKSGAKEDNEQVTKQKYNGAIMKLKAEYENKAKEQQESTLRCPSLSLIFIAPTKVVVGEPKKCQMCVWQIEG